MKRAERRALVKQAWVQSGGSPNVSQLAAQLSTSRNTVYRDIETIQHELSLESGTDAARRASADFYHRMRGMAEALFGDATLARNHNARVGYARVALEAQHKLDALLGLNAPQRIAQEGQVEHHIIVRHEYPDSDLAYPVPTSGRNRLASGALQDSGNGTAVGQDDARNLSN